MTETRASAGLIVNETTNDVKPCRLEVQVADQLPLKIETPFPIADGRYKLLAPGWEGDAIRISGEWEISKPSLQQKPAPATRSSAEIRALSKEIDKRTAGSQTITAAAKAALAHIRAKPDNDPPKHKQHR